METIDDFKREPLVMDEKRDIIFRNSAPFKAERTDVRKGEGGIDGTIGDKGAGGKYAAFGKGW